MRMLLLSALFGLAFGIVGTAGAVAAPAAAGHDINAAVNASSLLEQTAVICRRIKVCRVTRHGRRCGWERVCRRRW